MDAALQAEAEWLATRTCAERGMYLFEVAHNCLRGPEVAEALHRLVSELRAAALAQPCN